MVQVYIRGRGRGRYQCERCGIRCKKPSMLKKHLRSHTNIRPFTCMTCNFSFKTKGNLTKHLVSKSHKRRMLDSNNDEIIQGINNNNNSNNLNIKTSFMETTKYGGYEEGNEGEGRLVVVEEDDDEEEENNNIIPTISSSSTSQEMRRLVERNKQEQRDRMRWEEEDWDDDDEEDEEDWGEVIPQKDDVVLQPPPLSYRRFGQENILVERETHTPPTLWTRTDCFGNNLTLAAATGGLTDVSGDEEQIESSWPNESIPERICQSAPPSALLSPGGRSKSKKKKKKDNKINNSQANVSELKIISPTKLEFFNNNQDNQQELLLSSPSTENHNLNNNNNNLLINLNQQLNQQHQPLPSQTTLTNFIPSITDPQSQQQPSLAAQLAAGLLQAVPFNQQNNNSIDLSKQFQTQQQQFLFQQLNEQQKHQQQQTQQPSAFAPPNNKINNNFVSSALKFLECQMGVVGGSSSQIVGGDVVENNNEFTTRQSSSSTTTQSTLEAFLATDIQQYSCDLCERKFRKESELILHKQTHLIERKQQSKINSTINSSSTLFQCLECPTVVRTKSLLNKHNESVHGGGRNNNNEQQNNGQNLASHTQHIGPLPSSSQHMLPPQISTHNNHFRNFICTDCNLGFRSHGVLAKHLRSKNHIKMLVSLGKLSEDANSLLIRDHSKALVNIDASNCDNALNSAKELLANLRQLENNNNSTTMLIEPGKCSVSFSQQQQQSHQSQNNLHKIGQTPRISNNNNMGINLNNKRDQQLPHGLKRKSNDLPNNDDFGSTRPCSFQNSLNQPTHSPSFQQQIRRDSFSSPSPSRPKYSRDELAQQSDSPLHSLAQVAVAAAAAASASVSHQQQQPSQSSSNTHHLSPSISSSSSHSQSQNHISINHHNQRIATANVWVPPRIEQLQPNSIIGGSPLNNNNDTRKSITPEIHNQNGLISNDRLGSMLSNRSAEETSESTGTRSESSTPIQRNSSCQQNPGFSPMPAATRCQLCELNFDSPAQLSVHFHADHILMRHGRDFRCSRRNCEKVFPSRESLRAHIYGHFFGGYDGKDIEHHLQTTPLASAAASCPASPSILARRSTAPSAPPPCAQSPGIPEESHSAISSQLAASNGGGLNNQSFSSPPSVASSFSISSNNITPKTTGSGKNNKIINRRNRIIINEENNKIKKDEVSSNNLLCCQFCSEQLPDVQTLQAHWVKQHMSQLTRPHVCIECDAGFTTEIALQAHRERQHNNNINSSSSSNPIERRN